MVSTGRDSFWNCFLGVATVGQLLVVLDRWAPPADVQAHRRPVLGGRVAAFLTWPLDLVTAFLRTLAAFFALFWAVGVAPVAVVFLAAFLVAGLRPIVFLAAGLRAIALSAAGLPLAVFLLAVGLRADVVFLAIAVREDTAFDTLGLLAPFVLPAALAGRPAGFLALDTEPPSYTVKY
jgi:hypothetical protein